MVRRVLVVALLALVGWQSLTAGTGRVGFVGVGRDAAGAPVALVVHCASSLARVEVVHGPAGSPTVDLVVVPDQPTKDRLVSVPLTVGTGARARTSGDFTPVPGVEYGVVATDASRRYSAGDGRFTTQALADLLPGQVLVTSWSTGADGADEPVTVPMTRDAFERHGRETCD